MRRNRFLVVAFAFTLSCAGTTSLPKPGEIAMKPFSFRMRDFKAPSGLRIIVQEDHSAPVAGVVNVVGVGSSSEPAGKEGIAHFLEHMAFRMKPFKDSEATMWELLPRNGVAEFNAYTAFDNTTYFEFGPKEMLPQILRLEAARMIDPERGIDQKVVDTEREVVRNELRERGETAFTSSIFGWMQQALFPDGHPYHHPVVGTHDSLSNIKLEDIQKYAKLHYRLDNMTMFIIGDVDLPTVDKLLAQNVPWLYGDPKTPTAIPQTRLSPDPPPAPESPPHEGFYTYEGPVQTPEIWIGWTLQGGFRPDSVFYNFVAGEVNGALFDAVREDRDIAGVSAGVQEGSKATMLFCRVVLHEGSHPERSAEHVLNQLYKVWEPTMDATADKITATLFTHARVVSATGMALQSESIVYRAQATAENAHWNGDPMFFSHTIKALSDLDLEKIQQYAYKYLKRDRARMIYIKPLPPTARAKGAPTGLGGGTDDGAEARVPDYTTEQIRQLVKPAGFGQLKTVKLKNGLEMVVAKYPAIPAVTVQLGLHGGAVSGDNGLVRLADQAAHPWSKRHGQFSDYGAQCDSGAGEDSWEQQCRAGSGNLPNLFAILNDHLGSMAVPSGEIDLLKKYAFPYLKKQQDRPEAKADRAFWKALFGEHPYGRRPTIEDIEKYDSAAVEGWIKKTFAPGNGVMAVAGDVEPADAERMANEFLGEWNVAGQEVPPPPPPTLIAGPTKILVQHRPAATQGEVRLACLLPTANARNSVMYSLMTRMVADHLFKAVRGKLGASYGMHPGLGIYRGGAAWMSVSGNINNSSLAASLKVIKEYWDSLQYGDFTDKEMNRVRYEMAIGYNMRLTTSDAIADEIVRVRNLGWPLESVDQYGDNLAGITKDEMRSAFKACHESAVLSIVGDEDTVNKALKDGGWK